MSQPFEWFYMTFVVTVLPSPPPFVYWNFNFWYYIFKFCCDCICMNNCFCFHRDVSQRNSGSLFHIDTYALQTNKVFNLTNLGCLMDNTESAANLRKLIINKLVFILNLFSFHYFLYLLHDFYKPLYLRTLCSL